MQSTDPGTHEHMRRTAHNSNLVQRSASYTNRTRSDGMDTFLAYTHCVVVGNERDMHQPNAILEPHADDHDADSWVEIASQPSSSSLSSFGEEIVTTGLRVQHDPTNRRRRRLRPGAPTHLNISSRPSSVGATSSQDEYDESESESDRVMTSSNEGLASPHSQEPSAPDLLIDDEDENRTAVNYPLNNEHCFTPQPNAFSHPPSSHSTRNTHEHIPGSYFPGSSSRPTPRASTRSSYPPVSEARVQHSPFNVISPSHNAAADHDAALRASLSTLLSCAAAARGLPKTRQQPPTPVRISTRVDTNTLRLVPESRLPEVSPPIRTLQEPVFNPTIRRTSTSTSTSAEDRNVGMNNKDTKRKSTMQARSTSKDRRVSKKARRASSSGYGTEDFVITPTLLTWVVSAGVVVVLSALSFTAGYSMGKEAGKLETSFTNGGEMGNCAREAGRSGLGLRRLRFAPQV